MALRRITTRRRPLLPGPRAFFSSNPPFPPPPPPANDPDAAHSSSPHPNPGAPRNPASSLFQDIKERLRSSPSPPPSRRIPMNPLRPNSPPGATQPLEDVRRMLQSFRTSGVPPSSSTPSTPSFLDLLKDNAAQGPNAGQRAPGFDAIRQSLRMSPQQRQPRSQTPFMSNSSHIFNKEGKEPKDPAITLMKTYSYEDLGKKLGELRPAGVAKDGKEWFSLEELQERIAKLGKLEEQEDRLGGQFLQIRQSLRELRKPEKPPAQGVTMHAMLNLSGHLAPDYTRLPPQEELLERYFHPDHMSSEEKMKLELQMVRDEFKMSENDCGSARVQIAQLTVKIKHLSAVLHKKDKHSRKGLQEMVQRRKKYLRYLRRTDWDSYCLVLSKLGLRDVPEYKAPDYKSKSTTKAKSKKSKGKSKSKKRKMKA
ncbi:hypothetical protein BAE44_0012099 [Dichanthelium oligosanthes]|uniref:Small ribosomal subunit protein uS15c n=1 Tax=Dichanthelium oligosanthes TaxID=888268 RepID=A0A1E5VP17_9POAL|nr:hypothetical protein BAE44_0012099 [Dichanthelium oligosanthes]